MSGKIEQFYKRSGMPEGLISKKLSEFERNPDIADEFEYWIDNKEFKTGGVNVQGYDAPKLASLSEYIKGEGAFILLVELRENPKRALDRINRGFKKK